MIKIKFVMMAFSICFLVACAPSQQAIQTAVVKTLTALPTSASESLSTPTANLILPSPTSLPTRETNAAIPPQSSVTTMLENNGFVLDPLLEINCISPCTSYQHLDPWMVATVFENGEFEISSGASNVRVFLPLIQPLYGEDINEWIADHILVLVDKNEIQTGIVGNYDLRMEKIDNGDQVLIRITPRG